MPKVKQTDFKKFRSIVHEYACELNKKPKAELFCTCKRRKIISQNTVKICEL